MASRARERPIQASASLVVGDDGAGEAARSGARVGAQRALAVAAQLGGVARRELPVRFEVRLVACRIFLDALVGEGMRRLRLLRLLRHRGRQRKQQREGEEEAREKRHGGHPEGLSRNDPNAIIDKGIVAVKAIRVQCACGGDKPGDIASFRLLRPLASVLQMRTRPALSHRPREAVNLVNLASRYWRRMPSGSVSPAAVSSGICASAAVMAGIA